MTRGLGDNTAPVVLFSCLPHGCTRGNDQGTLGRPCRARNGSCSGWAPGMCSSARRGAQRRAGRCAPAGGGCRPCRRRCSQPNLVLDGCNTGSQLLEQLRNTVELTINRSSMVAKPGNV